MWHVGNICKRHTWRSKFKNSYHVETIMGKKFVYGIVNKFSKMNHWPITKFFVDQNLFTILAKKFNIKYFITYSWAMMSNNYMSRNSPNSQFRVNSPSNFKNNSREFLVRTGTDFRNIFSFFNISFMVNYYYKNNFYFFNCSSRVIFSPYELPSLLLFWEACVLYLFNTELNLSCFMPRVSRKYFLQIVLVK